MQVHQNSVCAVSNSHGTHNDAVKKASIIESLGL